MFRGARSRRSPLRRIGLVRQRRLRFGASFKLESRFQIHELLKEHRVPLRYSEADLEDHLHAHRELGVLPGR